MKYIYLLIVTFVLVFGNGCKKSGKGQFSLLKKDATGLDFRNMLKEDENFNIFKYQYYYNGGGVAIADFDNDGLQDVFFTGNMVKNRLFKNKGRLNFEDITEKSGVAKAEGWCTGANAVDINNDGWMDLYICRAGYPFPKLRKNLLYINNKDLTFTERAAEYGLDDDSYSTHAAFFDYDKDGDLDMFLLNHSAPEYSKGSLEIVTLKNKREPELESKLFRNDQGKYVIVSESAGITGNVLSLSLGLGISDINNDGWPDIFIGNDFNESDYLFLNNGNGTFTESSKATFDHTSMFSMGCDIADINNDGQMDLVSLDMLPESNYLQKLHSGADNYNKISTMISNGFQPQFSKNVLQINNGDGSFSECAQMYGMSNTDWSWASLFIDFDQDSYQDLFISNGYLRDHTDMDFLQFTADQVVKADKGENPVSFEKYMASMPPINQPNYFFHNENGKKFVNKNTDWALTTPSISHGSAYADFDNDGDVDIVTSNVGDFAYLYENTSDHKVNNYINIKLRGPKSNINAIGTRLTLYSGGQQYIKDLQPCRGFMSTMEYKIFFGLGKKTIIDSLRIDWPDGNVQKLKTDQINTTIEVQYDAKKMVNITPLQKTTPLFVKDSIVQAFYSGIDEFDDFKVQGLLTHYLTDIGPKCLVGDINGDKLEDFILTGNKVTVSGLYIQQQDGDFSRTDLPIKGVEISDIAFIQSKEQSLPDIVLSVGSYKYAPDTKTRGIYYFKNIKGSFAKPVFSQTATSNPISLEVFDIDDDGKQDLIVGGTCDYRMYPKSTATMMMKNDGNGHFSVVTQSEINIGLVNDMASVDLDGDKKNEIVIVGDWMPIKVFTIENQKLRDITSTFFEKEYYGFWKCIYHSNSESNQDISLIFGNVGSNSQLFASFDHPMLLFDQDYDQNGSIDPILATYIGDNMYPFAPREDMIKQIPMLNKRFNSFGLFAKADIKTMLGEKYFTGAKPLKINTLETSFFKRQNGKFVKINVDEKVQMAPVYSIIQLETANTLTYKLLLSGNQSKVRVKLGRLNGNHGLMIEQSDDGYYPISQVKSGFDVRGDTRDLAIVKSKKGDLVIFAVYNGNAQFYRRQN